MIRRRTRGRGCLHLLVSFRFYSWFRFIPRSQSAASIAAWKWPYAFLRFDSRNLFFLLTWVKKNQEWSQNLLFGGPKRIDNWKIGFFLQTRIDEFVEEIVYRLLKIHFYNYYYSLQLNESMDIVDKLFNNNKIVQNFKCYHSNWHCHER